MRSWFVPVLFNFCLCLGLWINDRSWNGKVFVYIGEDRAPAAIRAMGEYSSLDRKALTRAVHTQLLAEAQVWREGSRLGVQFGHPLVNRKGGGKEFGCQVQDHSGAYDRIEFVFQGTGVSEGGESPHMVVDAACRAQQDLNRLDTIWLPMAEIFATAPHDQDLQVQGDYPTNIRLESIPSAWPETWVLSSIRLYRTGHPEDDLALNANVLRGVRPKLLSFDWKQ